MSFLSYASTRPWAKSMRAAVLAKKMPPWFADSDHGKFQNDPSLTAAERDAIVQWADTGAAEGDPKSAPKALAFPDGWNIGKPDQVITMPEAYPVPAQGVIEYQNIIVPTGFREDKWVKAVEIRPGERSVVHHIIALVRPPGSRWLRDAKPGTPVIDRLKFRNLPIDESPEFLLSYTPGRPPVGLGAGQARLIKAGSDIVFQLHYTPNGKATADQSKLGLIYATERPTERVATLPIANATFVIPPGAPDHRVDASANVLQPAKLMRLIPHMHLRGKAFEVRLQQPGKDPRLLLRVPRYDFRWQNAYFLQEPIALAPGDRLDVTGWFDNSPNNPDNPDPKAEVRWGDQSWEEMMLNYIDVGVAVDAEPKNVIARPAPATAAAGGIKDRFIGVWKLISCVTTSSSGAKTYLFGERPEGRITYDKSGRMSALLMRPGRKQVGSERLQMATPDEMRKSLDGFTAYYGTFDVDEANHTVIHHVKLSLLPNWVGTDLKRTYEFDQNRMALTAVTASGSTTRLVWEREPD